MVHHINNLVGSLSIAQKLSSIIKELNGPYVPLRQQKTLTSPHMVSCQS